MESGVNNYMVYGTGDIPVGDYNSARLANLGLGHGAIDGGLTTKLPNRTLHARPGGPVSRPLFALSSLVPYREDCDVA